MQRNDALSRMREIQRIMEQTTLYTLLPGTQAIIGGVLALLGCVASWAMLRSLDFQAFADLPGASRTGFCIMWTVLIVVAILQEVVLTTRVAVQAGVDPLARPSRLCALSMTPGLMVALLLTIKLMQDGHFQYVAPVWTMCYGVSICSAGLFSIRAPRYLGAAFVVLGGVGLLLFPRFGVVMVALSFGLLHIVFGLWVIGRTRRATEDEQPD